MEDWSHFLINFVQTDIMGVDQHKDIVNRKITNNILLDFNQNDLSTHFDFSNWNLLLQLKKNIK
jgi:hypothetical protein